MHIFISSDHGGFDLKSKIIPYLKGTFSQHNITDLGPSTLNLDDDYPFFAFKLAQEVAKHPQQSLGILACRSGNGMVIAANKIKGAYAALCFTPHHAEMARHDDGANILSLDADYEDLQTHLDIIKKFIITDFAGLDSRHGRRLKEIQDYEASFLK